MAHAHLHLLCTKLVGLSLGWRNHVPHWDLARLLSLVYLKENMSNPYLTTEEIGEAFRSVTLEENYNFLEDDLVLLANAFVMAAMPAVVKLERELCIEFVASLNSEVAAALREKRGNL
jgi:hypothetical protein